MKKSVFLSIAAVLVAQTVMAQSVTVIERGGVRMHVFLSKPVIFQVASVVLESEKEVALVDAQFSADNARDVAALIRSTGKPLTTIYISHYDPDYYFGLDEIAGEFPGAQIVATPQTVWMIEATKDDKMEVWAPKLNSIGGLLAPRRVVVPAALEGDHFMVGDTRVEVRRQADDESHSWLWIPSARTILGGVYLQDGNHLWVADSPAREDRGLWLAALGAMEALRPELVIPAHFAPASSIRPGVATTAPIDFTRRYLVALENTLNTTRTAAETIARMRSLYPRLASEENLEMTARVLKGETDWRVVRAFPAIGRSVEVHFGEYAFRLDFHDQHSMTWHSLVPPAAGAVDTDTVRYTAVEVAPRVYMVWWTESDNTHVVHVEDYFRGVAHTNIASPDGSFTNLSGTLRLLPGR